MNEDILLNKLNNIFDKSSIKVDSSNKEKYRNDWSTNFKSNPIAVVFPSTQDQVKDLIVLCNELNYPLLGSGGRTGLSGGASALRNELIVSFDKMNKILEFDENSKTVLCQPGLVTQNLQSFADDNDLYYPVDFSSAGSSQIGGNIATNAGGIRVIKYGSTSRYVSGLELITGDGKVLSADDMLIKNATGPDLKSFFIGSEGILGLFTSCRIRLIKKPPETNVFLIGFDDLSSMDEITKSILSFDIEAFEFFTSNSLRKVSEEFEQVDIGGLNNKYYLIVELHDHDKFTATLEDIYKKELAQEIIISSSNSQKESIWKYRLLISESIARSVPIKFDIAVPANNVSVIVNELESFFAKEKSYELILFGHVGDGNLHVNVLRNSINHDYDKDNLIEKNIYALVLNSGGTLSAEHGIGANKIKAFMNHGNKMKIELLKNLKNHFDNKGILNPGKLVE